MILRKIKGFAKGFDCSAIVENLIKEQFPEMQRKTKEEKLQSADIALQTLLEGELWQVCGCLASRLQYLRERLALSFLYSFKLESFFAHIRKLLYWPGPWKQQKFCRRIVIQKDRKKVPTEPFERKGL